MALETWNEERLAGRMVPQASATNPKLSCACDVPIAQVKLIVSRASALTLWASVVAERLGHSRMTALTLAKAVAGTTARLKVRVIGREQWVGSRKEMGPALGLDLPRLQEPTKEHVDLLGKTIPLLTDATGQLRAALRTLPTRGGGVENQYVAADPAEVERYLIKTFSSHLAELRTAMEILASRYEPMELNRVGFRLYENFRSGGHDHEGRTGRAALEIENIIAALPRATNHDSKPSGPGVDGSLSSCLPRTTRSIPQSSDETNEVVTENRLNVRRINEVVAALQVTATELESTIAESRQLVAKSREAMALRNEKLLLGAGFDPHCNTSADYGV